MQNLKYFDLEGNDVLGSLDLCVALDANGVGNVYNIHCLVLNEISTHHNKACGYFNMTCSAIPLQVWQKLYYFKIINFLKN
jgi:hypothetical protein